MCAAVRACSGVHAACAMARVRMGTLSRPSPPSPAHQHTRLLCPHLQGWRCVAFGAHMCVCAPPHAQFKRVRSSASGPCHSCGKGTGRARHTSRCRQHTLEMQHSRSRGCWWWRTRLRVRAIVLRATLALEWIEGMSSVTPHVARPLPQSSRPLRPQSPPAAQSTSCPSK